MTNHEKELKKSCKTEPFPALYLVSNGFYSTPNVTDIAVFMVLSPRKYPPEISLANLKSLFWDNFFRSSK